MADAPQPKGRRLNIHIDPETAKGRYVNLAVINHTDTEFVIDGLYAAPQGGQAHVLSRMISSPKHTKRLLMALQENVRRYEEKHGTIEVGPSQHEEFVLQ